MRPWEYVVFCISVPMRTPPSRSSSRRSTSGLFPQLRKLSLSLRHDCYKLAKSLSSNLSIHCIETQTLDSPRTHNYCRICPTKMSSSDEKDLSLVLQTQEKRDMNPNITNRVISEMKGSLLFQSNWEELLMSAPVALSCLGGCYVASSSSTEAESIIFETPTGGFKYLRWVI